MAIYRPRELFAFLDEYGARPRKGLSQNFLIDGNIVRKSAATAAVSPGDYIIEIGPGPGALTEQLLERGATVLAVESDLKLADALERRLSSQALEVQRADILSLPLFDLLATRLSHGRRAKVVANLPYHLTSPILGLLLPAHRWIESVHVMVQWEVAKRLTASPGCGDYSALTLFTSLYGKALLAFRVSSHCFMPRPKVDSAVVSIELFPPAQELSSPKAFMDFVHAAFQQRRKTLKAALSYLWPKELLLQALQQCHLHENSRAEELSLAQFIELSIVLNV